MRCVRILLVLAMTIAALAQAPLQPAASTAGAATAPSSATVESFLRHTFGYDPNVKWQVLQIQPSPAGGLTEVLVQLSNPQGQQTARIYITPDQRHALVGELLPFGADPYAPSRDELSRSTSGIARGPANAALSIVEFSDLQCPSCKAAEPTIEKLLADHPNARFVFQHFPLPQHNWAMKAATFADCLARTNNAAFWKFAPSVYAAQDQITLENADKKLAELATAAGADAAATSACAAKPEARMRVEQSVELGKRLGVGGTPTLFLNGRKITSMGSLPYDVLNAIAVYQETQK